MALNSPRTAQRGILMAEIGMFLAVVGTLLRKEIVSFEWIIVGFIVGSLIGGAMAIWMPMTAMPQRIALSHSFGALAAARHKKDSPLYGMPILDADKARTIVILKRSLKSGFAGEDNELFYDKKTMMVFGDAKQTLMSLVHLMKEKVLTA
jgi:NAD/NADP transhydrogenase beta subunit